MPNVTLTELLRAVGPTDTTPCAGGTVGEAVAALFPAHPRLRGYLLDDQGRLRKHVAVFLNGELLDRAAALSAPVAERDEIYVMQALSGGLDPTHEDA